MRMAKFKMKLWLALGITIFITISMLFYINLMSYIRPFGSSMAYLSAHNCQDLYLNEINNVQGPIFQSQNNLKMKSETGIEDRTSEDIVIENSIDNYLLGQINGPMNNKIVDVNTVMGEYVELVSIGKGAKDKNSHIGDKFDKRRSHVLEECAGRYDKPFSLKVKKEKLDHIIVDEKNKLLFCYIPKVACTNWKRMLLLMTGKSDNISYVTNLPSYVLHSKSLFASLQNYSVPQVQMFLKSYKKFIFVRNPIERLLSAYRNKLEQHYNSSKYFQSRFGKFIVKKFRANPSNISLSTGDDVTFPEFVKYLLSISKQDYNEHWQTMTDLCFPCFLDYDYIGKYETLVEDSQFILQLFGINHPFPTVSKRSQTAASLIRYYRQLTDEVLKKLYAVYEMDFKLFDYNLESTLGL